MFVDRAEMGQMAGGLWLLVEGSVYRCGGNVGSVVGCSGSVLWSLGVGVWLDSCSA